MALIFGPVPSRRLGYSLGVDIVPLKTCTLDCIYCQVGSTTIKTLTRKEWVSSELVLNELRKMIERAIAELPEKLRSVIILREIEDLKYEEISDVLDMPVNSVKSYIHRGRRLMRTRLSSIYKDEYHRGTVHADVQRNR